MSAILMLFVISECDRSYFFRFETHCVDEVVDGNEEIEPDKPVREIRSEPLTLPPGFCWDTLDIGDPLVVSNCLNWLVAC